MSGTIPLVMTAAGPQPTPVVTIQQTTIANAAAASPDYTATLPGSMIEDMVDTSVFAISQADQARIDAINSVTPLGANAFVLAALGSMLGIPQGLETNTSVAVVFTATSGGSPASGLVIPAGVLVGDGSYQYATATSAITASDGVTQQVAAIATQSGSWSVAAGAVTAIATTMQTGFAVTVTNPSAGVPGTTAQTVQGYRAQVLAAEQVTVQGTGGYITTALAAIPGVQSRLILVVQTSGAIKIICGLTVDENLIAGAIYGAVADPSLLVGSATTARNVTVTVQDGVNTYSIVFVNPPNQVVTGTVTWATNLPSFAAISQVNQLAVVAFAAYINALQAGAPINLLEMTAVFQQAVAAILPAPNISALTFSININGVTTAPSAGTSLIPGDPESYFSAAANAFTVTG
ncbi:MAG: hypothetical protein ACYC3L_00985 [Gemmatimonadaceae bacterium]